MRLNHLLESENTSKIKFLKNSRKFKLKFSIKNGVESHLGRPGSGERATSPHHGAAGPWPRHEQVRDPQVPPLILPPTTPCSTPRKKIPHSSSTEFCFILRDFSISLLSPLFLLKFGVFDPWYVTPPLIQVEFHLVEYILSIEIL